MGAFLEKVSNGFGRSSPFAISSSKEQMRLISKPNKRTIFFSALGVVSIVPLYPEFIELSLLNCSLMFILGLSLAWFFGTHRQNLIVSKTQIRFKRWGRERRVLVEDIEQVWVGRQDGVGLCVKTDKDFLYIGFDSAEEARRVLAQIESFLDRTWPKQLS